MSLILAVGSLMGTAHAAEVPDVSGDIAFAYGRNWGQQLNVAALVGELKYHVHPQVAVGVRLGGDLGASVSTREGASAKAFTGLPLIAKGEGFLNAERQRPFAGLGVGVTFANAGGAFVAGDTTGLSTTAYAVKGPQFTVAPEIGVDLGGLRLALRHNFLLGSSNGVRASVEANAGGTSTEVDGGYPGLSGTVLQIGGHFGAPKES